jgi:hypothetical protein
MRPLEKSTVNTLTNIWLTVLELIGNNLLRIYIAQYSLVPSCSKFKASLNNHLEHCSLVLIFNNHRKSRSPAEVNTQPKDQEKILELIGSRNMWIHDAYYPVIPTCSKFKEIKRESIVMNKNAVSSI